MKTKLRTNEEIIFTTKKHRMILFKPILLTFISFLAGSMRSNTELGIMILIISGLSLLWLLYSIADRRTSKCTLTNLRIIAEFGVFSSNSKETPLDKVNNITYRKPLIGKIFNYGHVEIQSAALIGSTSLSMIEKPKEFRDLVAKYQENIEHTQNLADISSLEKYGSNARLDFYNELTKLHELKEKGIITEDDFNKRKGKILDN